MASYPKVDVHHHVIPPQIAGNLSGMKGMEEIHWSLEGDKQFSKSIGVKTAILSVSTPGVSHIPDPEESAKFARSMNEYSARIRDSDPTSYGFFATVPSPKHTALALQEIRYALDTLHADGITLFTSYGDYLGHPDFVPVWEELNARKAVVFIHPINGPNAQPFNEHLPSPSFDWPHETGRTAMDLILHKRLYQFPDLKIILSHAGGTLPLLARRSTLISRPEFGGYMPAEEIMEQAKSFYFDLALSGSSEVLPLILEFAKKGHVLFGSDFPHATVGMATEMATFIDGYGGMGEEKRREVYYEAAERLFPRLKGVYAVEKGD